VYVRCRKPDPPIRRPAVCGHEQAGVLRGDDQLVAQRRDVEEVLFGRGGHLGEAGAVVDPDVRAARQIDVCADQRHRRQERVVVRCGEQRLPGRSAVVRGERLRDGAGEQYAPVADDVHDALELARSREDLLNGMRGAVDVADHVQVGTVGDVEVVPDHPGLLRESARARVGVPRLAGVDTDVHVSVERRQGQDAPGGIDGDVVHRHVREGQRRPGGAGVVAGKDAALIRRVAGAAAAADGEVHGAGLRGIGRQALVDAVADGQIPQLVPCRAAVVGTEQPGVSRPAR
jgi:hypothetical protein